MIGQTAIRTAAFPAPNAASKLATGARLGRRALAGLGIRVGARLKPALLRILALALAPAFALAQPLDAATEIAVHRSPDGHEFWLVEERTIPILSLEISFKGGAALDPADRAGLASMMAALLREGAGTRDAVAFTQAREEIAARISFSAGRDAFYVAATMLSENRAATMALLRDAMVAPRFDDAAIERIRQQFLSGARGDVTNPNAILGRVYRETLLAGDPYGQATDGTEATLASITRADLVASHRNQLVTGRARIGIVGDIAAEEAGLMIDRLLAGLPAEGPPLPGPVAPAITGGVTIEAFDTPQSVVLFVQPGIDRSDPDFFPVFVLNHILGGGGFSSRLTTEVREKRGLTYGVYAYLANYDRMNLWMGGVSTVNARVAESIEVIRQEWRRMQTFGVTEEELANAKRYLTGAYPLRFDTNSKIAGILIGLQEDGQAPSYPQIRNDLVDAVTLEDVNRVARERLDPEALRFFVVGKPEGLSPGN
ncbi:MAG: pitrilysin family protein [Pseudomonadota bacterium]